MQQGRTTGGRACLELSQTSAAEARAFRTSGEPLGVLCKAQEGPELVHASPMLSRVAAAPAIRAASASLPNVAHPYFEQCAQLEHEPSLAPNPPFSPIVIALGIFAFSVVRIKEPKTPTSSNPPTGTMSTNLSAPTLVMNASGTRQQVPLRDYLNARIAPFLKKAMTESLASE